MFFFPLLPDVFLQVSGATSTHRPVDVSRPTDNVIHIFVFVRLQYGYLSPKQFLTIVKKSKRIRMLISYMGIDNFVNVFR